MRILIVLDHEPADVAWLVDLARAGLPPVAEVSALLRTPRAEPLAAAVAPAGAREGRRLRRDAVVLDHDRASSLRLAVETFVPRWSVDVVGWREGAADSLPQEIARSRPDLVVIVPPPRGLPHGAVDVVLRTTERSVRVVRPHSVNLRAPMRLVIGVDGSPGSAAAVAEAARRRWPPASSALVVCAVDPSVRSVAEHSPSGGDATGKLRAMLSSNADVLRTAGLATMTVLAEGDPRQVLAEEARTWDAECILVGARGLSAPDAPTPGSVAVALARQAPCSVEVVRPAPPRQVGS